jgi:DNA primase
VHDVNGQLVTLAGRSLPGTAKEMAKYLNGRESLLYSKSKTLYGLYQALRAGAIKAAGFAYLVEGYFDVISLHEADVRNAVAPCGTAITEEQVMFLKRYTQHVVLMQDADKAGTKSMLKAIDLFLAADFKVDVLQLPTGMDADDYARKLMARQPAALEEAA